MNQAIDRDQRMAGDRSTAALSTTEEVERSLWLGLASITFIVDAISTGEPWRLLRTILCPGLAGWMSRMRPPTWT
jgi:hypothetical protein